MARKSKVTTELDVKTGKAKKNLKQLDAQARKTGKGFGQTAKGGRSADRAMKGVSRQSSGASKNFSKMSQGMTGGLVPAYATLAAQVFAVTALFRFLKEAADYRVMIEGQKAFAAETGVAYRSIAKSLQEATDGQLTYKDASQAAAIASAAGLSGEQLERLATGARNVSIALGRDLTDSFNRLIRGTTKAEPELLDELGIILRLEEATKNYAAQIGKTKEQLTIYEKSQAVTVEVLKQVEDKFGSIGNNAELQVNAIAQFAKAFDDLLNKVYEFIGPVAEGLARFFTKNLYAFAGALTIFAIPILKMILPSMDAWIAKTEIQVIAHNTAYEKMKANLLSYQTTLKATAAGAGVNRGLFGAQATKMGISTSGRGKAAAITHFETETTKIVANENYKRTGILKNASAANVAILKKSYNRMMTDTKGTTTFINRQWQTMGLRFKVVTTGMKTMWAGTMGFMKKTASKIGKFLGKASIWLMAISMLVMLWDLIKPYLGFEDKDDPYSESVTAAKELNKELKLMATRFNQKIGSGAIGDTLKDGIDLLKFKGSMAASADLEKRLGIYGESDEAGKAALLPGLRQTLLELEMVEPAFRVLNHTIDMTGEISKTTSKSLLALASGMINGKMAAQQLTDAMADLTKAKNAYITGKAKLSFDAMITPALLGIEAAKQSAEELRSGTPEQKARLKVLEADARAYGKQYMEGGAVAGLAEMQAGRMTPEYTRTKGIFTKQEAQAVEFDEKGAELERFATKYIGFATEKLGFDRESMDLDIASVAAIAGRSDAYANQFKKELAWKKKGFEIDSKRVDLKIAEDLKDELKDKPNSPKYLAAVQMVKNEEKKLALYIAQEKALENLKDPLKQVEVAALNAFSAGMENAIMGVIDGTKSMKEGFLDMAKAVITAIAQIIVKLIAMKAIEALGFSLGEGGVIAKAGGGYIGNKKPKGYRSGGVATEPTYLVGEGRYNEAVVPLPDGRSIPVEMKGGTSSNVVVNVNVASDGQTTSALESDQGQQAANLGRAISVAVTEELYKQKRPGGALSPYG